jgi:hypothetical protein
MMSSALRRLARTTRATSSNASCPYRVSYRFLGFQALKSNYKQNQTIPVKFMLANAAGTPISDANAQTIFSLPAG